MRVFLFVCMRKGAHATPLHFAGWINMVVVGSILFYLNKTEGIAKTASYTMLTPLFGCIFAALLLHEKFPVSLYIGSFWI
jgi:drug/metabolite transporter (DMT)-like permease